MTNGKIKLKTFNLAEKLSRGEAYFYLDFKSDVWDGTRYVWTFVTFKGCSIGGENFIPESRKKVWLICYEIN